jgi:N-methylhydantoinase A/oxoprolinase/acetone carboxylase beta subunit
VDARPREESYVELEDGRCAVPALRRETLVPDCSVSGPAVIEEDTSVVFVPPGWRAQQSREGHLRVVRV